MQNRNTPPVLCREDWAPEVRQGLNNLLAEAAALPPHSQYAVFDFDNTTAIFDIEENLAWYQLSCMAFVLPPEQLRSVLLAKLSDPAADRSATGLIRGSYRDLAEDITQSYATLWEQVGPFTPAGLAESAANTLPANPHWQAFAAKLRTMYDLVCLIETEAVAYTWILGWFTGMTESQIYDLAARCVQAYRALPTQRVTLRTPAALAGRTGAVGCSLVTGISVTENIKELWAALQQTGVDVWVCSASGTAPVRAAIDGMGLHEYITGMLALTPNTAGNGCWQPGYDPCGCGWLALQGPAHPHCAPLWQQMTVPQGAPTVGEGKVTAITRAIAPRYGGHGPIAGFMDSTGDYQFCTEFASLRTVVCFNRANRSTADGGGLIAAAALYQRDRLSYTYQTARAAGDTLYLLQGRDENGLRSLRPANDSILFGTGEPRLFQGADHDALLEYLCREKPATRQILNTLAVKNNPLALPFAPGFLKEYAGYHTRP